MCSAPSAATQDQSRIDLPQARRLERCSIHETLLPFDQIYIFISDLFVSEMHQDCFDVILAAPITEF